MTVPADMYFAVHAPALGSLAETSASYFKTSRLKKGTGRGLAPFGVSDDSEAR
jgi:hypothetical protein